jgi:hypothetical protein
VYDLPVCDAQRLREAISVIRFDELASHQAKEPLTADPTMPALPALRNQLLPEPDLLRGLVEQTVNAILSEDADAGCRAGHGERSWHRPIAATGTASALGYACWHDRREAAGGRPLPGLGVGSPTPGREGLGVGRC